MELQTIRAKLQSLNANPPEVVDEPWEKTRRAAPSPQLAQMSAAVATLRQRSNQDVAPTPRVQNQLQQFHTTVNNLNQLAQQQQQTIAQLRYLATDISQHVPAGLNSQTDAIARFLNSCDIVDIPLVEWDEQGDFTVRYLGVDFHQPEREAQLNARTLRSRNQQPASTGQSWSYGNRLSHRSTRAPWFNVLTAAIERCRRWLVGLGDRFEQESPSSAAGTSFTLMDAAIWCSGATIARIVLRLGFQMYPALWTPVAVGIFLFILVGLYQALLSRYPNPIMGYRILMVILGLLIGGQFP